MKRSKARGGGSSLEFRTSDAVLDLRQRQGARPHQERRRDHARPHDPHQELAAAVLPRRKPASSTTSRKQRTGAPVLRRALSRLFCAPQRARRRHQAGTRSPAPRRAGARSRPVRPRPTKQDAIIAADIAETWIECVSDAEAIGRFESISEADMFDCEYWPLEQTKLGARKELPLAGSDRRRHRRGPALLARQRQELSPQPAPKSRCSTSISRRRASKPRRSARRLCRSNAT